ncbi:MAG: Hsp20/alpha crystallin family protein [Prevotella sp.]|nr:Hsp20/alpha crystallin family protein [Prevotella sp.]
MLLARRNNDSNWMSNFFDDFFDTDWMPRMNGTAPAVNVKENEKQYEMDIAAPGLKKEFCRVDLDDSGNLRVKLENKMEHRQEDKKEHYLRREFSYTNYEQSYVLPDDVERDGISAKVEDGVLHIVMPRKAPEAKVQKRIEVG